MADRQPEHPEKDDRYDAKSEGRDGHGSVDELRRVGRRRSGAADRLIDQPAITTYARGGEDDVHRIEPADRYLQIGRALDAHEAHVAIRAGSEMPYRTIRTKPL